MKVPTDPDYVRQKMYKLEPRRRKQAASKACLRTPNSIRIKWRMRAVISRWWFSCYLGFDRHKVILLIRFSNQPDIAML
jgi:hypothetical protein